MTNRPHILVEYKDVKITVVEATSSMGITRSVLSWHGYEANQKAGDSLDETAKIMQGITYPNLISPVLKAEGTLLVYDLDDQEVTVDFSKWPIPLPEFSLLPDALTRKWEDAVYQMNSHWSPEPVENPALEKKE